MKFDTTIDFIQKALVWFVISVITVCIAVLFLFDALAGTGTMLFLTGGKEWQSVVISLATTGLLFSLMFIGYVMSINTKSGLVQKVGKGVLVASAVIYIQDIIFDALLADVLRFGTIDVAMKVDILQWMFRGLIGGISTVGDALAIAMISGMPVLKSIVNEAVGNKVAEDRPKSPMGSLSQPQRDIGAEVFNSIPRAQVGQKPYIPGENVHRDIPQFMQKHQQGGKRYK